MSRAYPMSAPLATGNVIMIRGRRIRVINSAGTPTFVCDRCGLGWRTLEHAAQCCARKNDL